MLVLSRKPGERIIIGEGIEVTVLEVHGNRIRLGIQAPKDVSIQRTELQDHNHQNQHRGPYDRSTHTEICPAA